MKTRKVLYKYQSKKDNGLDQKKMMMQMCQSPTLEMVGHAATNQSSTVS